MYDICVTRCLITMCLGIRCMMSSEKTSLPEFFCSASLCEASKKITGNGFFPTFVTQLDSKFWPGFASQKSRSSFCFTSFDFRFLSKFLISFAWNFLHRPKVYRQRIFYFLAARDFLAAVPFTHWWSLQISQLNSKFWPGFAFQKSRSSFCLTSFVFIFLSKFFISLFQIQFHRFKFSELRFGVSSFHCDLCISRVFQDKMSGPNENFERTIIFSFFSIIFQACKYRSMKKCGVHMLSSHDLFNINFGSGVTQMAIK